MLPILYEDEYLIAVDKPSDIHSSSLPGEDEAEITVATHLAAYLKNAELISEKKEDAGLIQRLDGSTSGIIVAAKTRSVWMQLREALQQGAVHKTYLAVVEGEAGSEKIVSSYLGNPNRGASKVRVYEEKPGKKERALPARTIFKLAAFNKILAISLVEATAPTARRHQIRVHAAHIKIPLLGDILYGATKTLGSVSPTHSSRNFILHASKMELDHPVSNRRIKIESAIDLGVLF